MRFFSGLTGGRCRVLAYLFIGTIFIDSCNPVTAEDPNVEKISFCNDEVDSLRDKSNGLIYVTTLDGKLTALDATNGGSEKWSLSTGPGPLLSSSIHRLELTNNGKWVRMIPSLSGGLYKFDGDSIEAIPINADDLLKSSFKFSDELVISGGKETRSYGVSARTGQVLYECSITGCKNQTDSDGVDRELSDHNPLLDDVIVVRRQTQTVRAIEPRTGSERWNFSIGQHEVELLQSDDCRGITKDDPNHGMLDLELKIIVPEGIVCAINKNTPNVILWKHKFDYPIVSAWKPSELNTLDNIDLFTGAQWLWNGANLFPTEPNMSPSLYLGMHQKQLYIQESDSMQRLVNNKKSPHNMLITDEKTFPRIPWKPFPATSSALALIEDNNNEENGETAIEEPTSITAISVLYASEYVNGNGFYLYATDDSNASKKELCSDNNDTSDESYGENIDSFTFDFDPDTPVKIIIVSLWFWWKEIVVIALTTAFILNVMLKFRNEKEFVIVERHIEVPVPMAREAIEEDYSHSARLSSRSLSESNNSDNYTSRFSSDFDLVQCLGKGGFGVVFEVKNRLDDCSYAIKRVVLPNKQESRDRVMREVKTLANCEHQNIVRYFHAWVETPPPGWQENQDKIWIERNCLSTSIDIETPTDVSTVSKYVIKRNKSIEKWIPNFPSVAEPSFSSRKFTEDESNNTSSLFESSQCDGHTFPSNRKDEDCDESSGIVFRDPTNDADTSTSHHIIAIEHDTSVLKQKSNKIMEFKKTHRRPSSLDLTSRGNVVMHPINVNVNKIYLYIQMQLCRKQSLKEWLCLNTLDNRNREIVPIFEQIVDGVEYVHLKGLIHRDLKPSNIFFSLDGQIKIGDFGLVTDMSDLRYDNENNLPNVINQKDRHTKQVGTQLYMSPEQLNGLHYNYKVDIYSLGLILFELLVSFGTEMERITVMKGVRDHVFPDDFQASFTKEYELLKLMLSESPGARPTTLGIKARPPLRRQLSKQDETSTTYLRDSPNSSPAADSDNLEWHFELPPIKRRDSRANNLHHSNSSDSNF